MGAEIGKVLSHYRILAKLGEGGMGVVYLAEDEKLHRHVAVKLLRPDSVGNEESQHRFLREATSAASLNHPYIATIYEADEAEGTTFIAMEYVEGETLRSRLANGALSVREALQIGVELAEGLCRAHQADIVHRDLKPENLMVRPDGHVKILDFGLARLVEKRDEAVGELSQQETKDAQLTERGEVLGTPAYMSPEQARGELVDPRSDIFAFGSTLYEMLTGKSAFRGPSRRDTLTAILREEPPRVSTVNAMVPPECERILEHCLEKKAAERYQDTQDLVLDLKHLQREIESRLRGPFVAPTTSVPKRLRWGLLWAGTAVGLAVIAVLAWQRPWESHRTDSPPDVPSAAAGRQAERASIAVLPFADMSAEKDQEYFCDGISEEVLSALTGTPGLRVTGRTSAFSFKGKNEDLRLIAQKLNVGVILEGSVRKAGNRVRITAQLVNATDGFRLWSETYDRTLDDIFLVQEDIARSVTGALKLALVGKEGRRPRAENVEAYNAYLQGQYFARFGKEGLERALGYFQHALALDSSYAPAWVGLADGYTRLVSLGYVPMATGAPKARQAIAEALALDENSAVARSQLAWIKMRLDWDWQGAVAEAERALAIAPSDPRALFYAASVVAVLGQLDRALALYRRAVEIDPLDAECWLSLGRSAWRVGRADEAEAATRKAIALIPERPLAHWMLGQIYLTEGKMEAALAEIERETHPVFRIQGLALAYHAAGRKKDEELALAELIERHQNQAAYQIVEVYACRGEVDRVFEWLERAHVQRDTGLTWIKGDPLLKHIERDPRYAAFLEKLGLPL